MKFRKFFAKLHLYVGLLSGVVVLVVCLTGSIYTFKDEITDLTQPYRFVTPEDKPMLLPSAAITIANAQTQLSLPTAITYGEKRDAVSVDYFSRENGMTTVWLNPYNAKVNKTVSVKNSDFDFFRFVLDGHRRLWLPHKIGKYVVGISVLLFVIALVTGIVLWLPKRWNKQMLKNRLSLKRKTALARRVFDFHSVLGFYAAAVLLVLSLTGLIWSFDWFSQSVYFLTSGGKTLQPYAMPPSDTLQANSQITEPLDELYTKLRATEPRATTLYFALPRNRQGIFRVSVVHQRGSYYKTDNLFFDQYTLKSLRGAGAYAGKFTEAPPADRLRRMNLDIHTGRIWGIAGKLLVFLAGLIGASLPITGFMMWRRKKHQYICKKLLVKYKIVYINKL